MRIKKAVSVLGSGLVSLSLFVSNAAEAAPELRVQVEQQGDFVIFGNTLGQDCALSTPLPVVGTVGSCGANTSVAAPDVFWRSDSPADGQAEANDGMTVANARSTAMLVLPDNATVTHAYLYWAAAMPSGVNNGGASATFEFPGKFSQSVNALATYRATRGGTPIYQSVADVTAAVKDSGPGAYRVGGIDSVNLVNLNNPNAFAAWWMVVFYTLNSDSPRSLALFDGLDVIQNSGADGTATLSHFFVPEAGYTAKLGVVGFAGSAVATAAAANSLYFENTLLSNPENPANNFFNSTHSLFGTPVSTPGDLPQLTGTPGSMSGIDIDVIDVTDLVIPGQASATIQATATQQNAFFLGGFVASISTLQPDFAGSIKSVRDINGGALLPGDVLEYTIVAVNRGDDGSKNTVLTDPLPAGVTFVPGSLAMTDGANANPKTDKAGDDQAEYDPASRTVTFRLGTGATATNGGTLAIGESTTVTFQVTVDANAVGTISNQASIRASGQAGAGSASSSTGSNTGGPGSSTDITIDHCGDATHCNEDTPLCKTDAHPFVCVECLSDKDCPASGAQCEANACTTHTPPDGGSDASPDGSPPDASLPDASIPDADQSDAGQPETDAANDMSVTGVGMLCNARPGRRSSSVATWFVGLAAVALLAHRRRRTLRS